jgi:hypothetical protein
MRRLDTSRPRRRARISTPPRPRADVTTDREHAEARRQIEKDRRRDRKIAAARAAASRSAGKREADLVQSPWWKRPDSERGRQLIERKRGERPKARKGSIARSFLAPADVISELVLGGKLTDVPRHVSRNVKGLVPGTEEWERAHRPVSIEDAPKSVGILPWAPLGKGFRTSSRAARVARKAARTDRAVEKVDRAAREYEPRTIRHNELEQQLPKSRSKLAKGVASAADKASEALQRSERATKTPGVRLATTGERAAKGAGREQRIEQGRRVAGVSEHLRVLSKIKEGSAEDVAHFWYAQLPSRLHSAEGLQRVRAKQSEELAYLTSGKALEDLNAWEGSVKAQLAKAETSEQRFEALKDLAEIRVLRTDLPQRVDDVSASIAELGRVIEKAPRPDAEAIAAVRALSRDRQRVLVESGRLKPERAGEREGLISRWLGEEPTGEESYIGHRLPRPESFRGSNMPSGGVGRVRTPQGVARENRLVLAKTGRLRPSLRVAAEDWQSAQVFEQANTDRQILGEMGESFAAHDFKVPSGHVLVNPKGRTIPPHWKTDELAQFGDNYEDVEGLRTKAQEILDGFVAEDEAGFQRMQREALESGVQWDELRVVPKRLVDRYYAQFRASRGRGAALKGYDAAVDAVATSIVFARIGYVPKNIVQNLIMAAPHQGPLLLVNAVRAAQAMKDPELRALLRAEVGFSGATSGLGREAFSQKLGRVAGFVGKIADDPIRISAFLHEAAAEGVIPRVGLLTEKDRAALLSLLRDKSKRPLLNDIRSRSTEAMADFSRLTPDQARIARRFLIIPGWLMAGSRYPFHFAVNHPIRSALLAYIAMGEPGAPEELRFNKPVDEYFTGGAPLWTWGIQLSNGRVLRMGSLSPVGTPWEIGQAAVRTAQGETGIGQDTAFDYASPFGAAIVRGAQGEGLERSLLPLAPNVRFIEGMISPEESKWYPEDATRWGRLKRELGVIPIEANSHEQARYRKAERDFLEDLDELDMQPSDEALEDLAWKTKLDAKIKRDQSWKERLDVAAEIYQERYGTGIQTDVADDASAEKLYHLIRPLLYRTWAKYNRIIENQQEAAVAP